MRTKNIAAIIVAGGYSSRMNAFKPLLPLGNSTVIENTIEIFLKAGIVDITVVTGFNAYKLKPIIERKNARYIYNERYYEGMFSSVIAGVKALEQHIEAMFFQPGDIPLVKADTICNLYDSYNKTKHDIIYPVYQGKRGHPPLISNKLFPEILNYEGCNGLKEILRRHQERAIHIEVDDKGILMDIDTYEDFIKLKSLKEK